MGRSRGRGTVRNSRFCGRFESKVWRQRCSSPARFVSAAKPFRGVVALLRSRAVSRCFREPRFWSLAGPPRNRAQSHQSHVQRWSALTPAKGGRVPRETATSHRAQATLLSHRKSQFSSRATITAHRYSRTWRGKKVPSLPMRLQATVVLPTTNHQECNLMALQPPRMANSRVTQARMAVKE